jgi:predicted RNA-binding Zn ribbon-like protein
VDARATRPARSVAELPPHAALLRDFVNTYDIDESAEALVDPPALVRWLAAHHLVDQFESAVSVEAEATDLSLAHNLREALRAEFLAHHDLPDDHHSAAPVLQATTAELMLRVDFTDGRPRLEPVEGGVRGALARLAAAAVTAQWDGSWERLKVCPADDCQWAFYDTSKNRSRTWCSMRVCGNRTKTRTYRRRHRTPS